MIRLPSSPARRRLCGLALALCLPALPLAAEAPVARGDVLFVSVTGAPELTRDCPVDVDGRIRLPLVGGISVAGLSLDAIQDAVAQALVSRDILRDPVVLVEVSRYRPVYVGGQVRDSGDIDFQPGMTVRQAIVAAGGVQAAEADQVVALGDILDLLAQQRAAEAALLALDSEIARLEDELGNAVSAPPADPAPVRTLDSALLQDIVAERTADRAYADKAIALTDVELEVLAQLATHQAQEQVLQREEVAAARSLVDRGLAPKARLQELEREESRLARDVLENQTFVARANQNRATIAYQTEAAEIARRIATRADLRRAQGDRIAQVAVLDALRGRLLAAGRVPGDPTAAAIAPVVAIFRNGADGPETVPATMDSEITPGDVIEVSLSPAPPRG